MPSGREELRRGVRDLIETASREMGALVEPTPPAPPVIDEQTSPTLEQSRPILRLVRDVPQVEGPAVPAAPPVGAAEATGTHARKGVCAAYYLNRRCWELPDAYCNQALHVCMLRECPVYHLNREKLEQRFSRKFSHLW